MKIKGDKVTFESTGVKQYASRGIIGIDPELNISGGYDDTSISRVWVDSLDDTRELSKEERKELATHMINLWQQYADKS
jgi:hypothetical protein